METSTESTNKIATYKINRTGERPLRFKGELIGEGGGKWHNGREQTRWTEIEIYRTTGGNLVGVNAYVTLWQGESGTTDARVCKSEAELVEFLGTSEIAKAAYKEAGIDIAEDVE